MIDQQRILVYLANGVQGGAVARQALSRGLRVRALVRDMHRGEDLKRLGAELVCGDLQTGSGLEAAHAGVDYVVLQMPLGPLNRMAAQMDRAIVAMHAGAVKGVIVKMANADPGIETPEPGLAGSRIIVEKMRDSGLMFSVVRPTMYLDNFLKPDTRNAIVRNGAIVYPLPAQQRVAWTCADDAARTALTLLDNRAFGVDQLVSGPEAIDGEGLARAFSTALGRIVRFESLALDDFEQEIDSKMGAGMGQRVSSKFRFFEEHPHEATRMLSLPFQPSAALPGFAPTTIQDWVTERRGLFDRAEVEKGRRLAHSVPALSCGQ